MRSFNKLPPAIQRAPATFSLVVATTVCFLLFYPLQWVGMLELFNFVPFRAAGGYVAFGEWGDWWRLVTPTLIHFGWLHVVFNCLWLWEFGQRIEHRLGGVNLLGLYVISAMASNFCHDRVFKGFQVSRSSCVQDRIGVSLDHFVFSFMKLIFYRCKMYCQLFFFMKLISNILSCTYMINTVSCTTTS